VVECTALEMRRAREGTEGSNPSLSATQSRVSANAEETAVFWRVSAPFPNPSVLQREWEAAIGHRILRQILRRHGGWYRFGFGRYVQSYRLPPRSTAPILPRELNAFF
jgi:hypothetical protein